MTLLLQIKRIRNSKIMRDTKSVVKNSIFNIIYKGFTAIFPLVTTSYIAKILLPEGVGKVEYAITIVTYFVTIASLGIPSYGVKAVAQASEDEKGNVFFELLTINSASTVLCIIAYYVFIFSTAYFTGRRMLFAVVGLMLFLNLFNIDWFLQGIEEYSYIAVRGIVMKIVSFAAMLIFVKNENDYINYAFVLCVGTAGNYLLNVFRLKKYIVFKRYNLHIKRHLIPVLVLFATTVATQIYTMLDSTMLEYIHGEIYVGYYSTAVKIVRMIYTVSIAMVAPLYPRISGYIKDENKDAVNAILSEGTRIVSLIAFPAAVGLFCMADWIIVVLFGDAFMPSALTLRILSPLVIVFSLAYFLGHIILMSLNREKTLLYSTILGASVNVILNSLLIPGLQQNGAAIASLIAEICVTAFVVLASKKYYKLDIDFKFASSVLVSSFSMGVITCILKNNFHMSFIGLCGVCVCGAIVYFGGLLLQKNREMIKLCSKIAEIWR